MLRSLRKKKNMSNKSNIYYSYTNRAPGTFSNEVTPVIDYLTDETVVQ